MFTLPRRVILCLVDLLDFGVAQEFGGYCNLRFDDTNPCKEDVEYVDSIKEDVRWLGFDWEDRLFFASDFFEDLYLFAEKLIVDGKAYVDEQTLEQTRQSRGTLTEAGQGKSASRSTGCRES